MQTRSAVFVSAMVAMVAAGVVWLVLEDRAARTPFRVGLVFDRDACELSPGFVAAIGGPLTPAECADVERLARREVALAFEGFRVELTSDPRAFWTVHVVQRLPARARTLGAAGASLAFGPLGGRGAVALMSLAGYAVVHAPADATRGEIIEAVGRGVGRSVVHEFAHQIAGGAIDGDDPLTYEYGSANRAVQFYGELRWGRAGDRVRARLQR